MPDYLIVLIVVLGIVLTLSTIIFFIVKNRLIRDYPLEYSLATLLVIATLFVGANFFIEGKFNFLGLEIEFSSLKSDVLFLISLGMILFTIIVVAGFIVLLKTNKNK